MSRSVPGWPGVTDTRLVVAGRRVRVLRASSRSRAAREPQLLLHGLGASAATWIDVLGGLAEHGPVVAVDLPGFGRTSPTVDDGCTVQSYVDFVAHLADALGWSRFTLHGNSMGGLVAALFAARHPERVQRLVLVSPALPPRWPARLLLPTSATIGGMVPIAATSLVAAALGVVGLAGPELSEHRNRQVLKLIYPEPDAVDRSLLALMAADLAAADGPDGTQRRRALLTALGSIAGLWADPRGTWRAIDRIAAPTLLLGGTRDALVPARTLRAVLARRPDWEGHVLTGRRHALMLEDPRHYLDLDLAHAFTARAIRAA